MSMRKVKYYYNQHTLRYEKVESTWKQRILISIGFLCAMLVFCSIITFLAFRFFDSPKEKLMRREMDKLVLQLESQNKKMNLYQNVLSELQDRDDNIYRIIFEADPIPSSVRTAGIGGVDKYADLEGYSNTDLLKSTAAKMDLIGRQLYIQSKSYDEIVELVKDKEELYAHIPAIQPIANKDLKRVASGYGYRIDPIYKTSKFHKGMDFSAPTRTEVYATGAGKVSKVERNKSGYGNHVVIDHGYNYKTLYAHLDKVNVDPGQKLKRGDIIGYVGSTGKSTAPHLHYEVIRNSESVNPINYYFNDLNSEQYDQMIEMSERANQSFD
jgi:murein DD-endopeptidase MepM/ murein hydrolase activator NlpD